MNEQEKLLEKEVKGWAVVQKNRMVSRVLAMQLKDKIALKKRVHHIATDKDYKPLAGSLGFGLKKDLWSIERINFRFARHGIFYEHGVGNGRLRGSAKAKPNPYLGITIDRGLNDLADILANSMADIAVEELKFFIPGVIDRRLKINNNG